MSTVKPKPHIKMIGGVWWAFYSRKSRRPFAGSVILRRLKNARAFGGPGMIKNRELR